MADDANQNPDNANPPAAPATQPGNGAPQITPEIQALIDAAKTEAAQQAKNAAWAEARRTFEAKQQKPTGGQPPQPKPQEQPASAAPPATDVRAELNRIRSFEREAGKYGLSADALETLEEDFNTANPPDPAAWVQKRATAFGWKPAGQAATPNGNGSPPSGQPASNPVVPTGPPVTSRGAPPPAGVPTDDTPIMSLSESDRKALIAKIGDVKYAERMLKEMARDNVRVRPRLV